MKLDINTKICPKNMWARQLNGRGTKSKRYLSCALASLIAMATVILRKALAFKSYLLKVINVYLSK